MKITIGNIIAGITERIEKEFNISVVDKDITELNNQKPAFVIETDDIESDKIGLMEHCSFIVRIYYMADNRYKGYADLYTIAERLLKLFAGNLALNAGDTVIRCVTLEEQEIEMSRADMGVCLSGRIDFVNSYEDTETAEIMDDINVEI